MMRTSQAHALIAFCALALLTWSCGGQPAPELQTSTVMLVATGNVNNEIGPCG